SPAFVEATQEIEMFTVKAVVECGAPTGENTVVLFAAEQVRIRASKSNGDPPYIPPQYEVELSGGAGNPRFLEVGSDRFAHYQTIYVMNERGATVEKLHASVNPSAPEIPPDAFPVAAR